MGLLALLLIWILAKAGRLGLTTWMSVSDPERIEISSSIYRRAPVKSFLVGLVSALILFVLFLIIMNLSKAGNGMVAPIALIPLLILAGVGICATLLGMAGIYQRLGARLTERNTVGEERGAQADWRETLKGGALIELATLVPLLGNLMGAFLMVSGLGVCVLAYRSKKINKLEGDRPGIPRPTEDAGEDTPGSGDL